MHSTPHGPFITYYIFETSDGLCDPTCAIRVSGVSVSSRGGESDRMLRGGAECRGVRQTYACASASPHIRGVCAGLAPSRAGGPENCRYDKGTIGTTCHILAFETETWKLSTGNAPSEYPSRVPAETQIRDSRLRGCKLEWFELGLEARDCSRPPISSTPPRLR